jgi:hypothetical protein
MVRGKVLVMIEALLRFQVSVSRNVLLKRRILTQAETVATKRSRIAWICMMMVLENWMMFVRWNLKLWTKVMEEMSVGWSPSYRESKDPILTLSCPQLLILALIRMKRLICVDHPELLLGPIDTSVGSCTRFEPL